MIKNTIIVILIAVVIGGGVYVVKNRQGSLANLDDFKLDANDVEQYLAQDNRAAMQPQYKQKLLQNLVEQNALAEVIAQESKNDWSSINTVIKVKRNEKIVQRYFENIESMVVDDADVDSFYKNNVDKYSQTKIRVAHILFRTHPKLSSDAQKTKRSLAEDVLKQISEGAVFEELVKAYSEDVLTVGKQGEIGWIENDKQNQAIYSAVESLQAGGVSDTLVETPKGLHIVKLLEEPVTKIASLEEVAEKIRYQIRYQRKMEERERIRNIALDRINREMKQYSLAE